LNLAKSTEIFAQKRFYEYRFTLSSS